MTSDTLKERCLTCGDPITAETQPELHRRYSQHVTTKHDRQGGVDQSRPRPDAPAKGSGPQVERWRDRAQNTEDWRLVCSCGKTMNTAGVPAGRDRAVAFARLHLSNGCEAADLFQHDGDEWVRQERLEDAPEIEA